DDMHWALSYWQGQKEGWPLPPKHKIDVTDFPPRLLPMLFLLEWIEQDDSYVVRLAGTAYRDIYRREITRMSADRLLEHSDAGANLKRALTRALAEAVPVFSDTLMTWPPTGAQVTYQRLLLPYSGEPGRPVRFFLGVARITDRVVSSR